MRPLYAVARRLLARKASVTWATVTDYFGDTHETIARRIDDPRVRVLPPVPVTHDPRRAREDFAEMLSRDGEYGRLLEAHLRYEVAAEADHLRAIIRRERPDVIASDGLMQACVIACELERVPYVHVWTGLYPVAPRRLVTDELRVLARYLPMKREVFTRFGLSPRLCYGGAALSPYANTVFARRELVGAHRDVQLVGPYKPTPYPAPPFDWRWIDRKRPLIYVSFGSMLALSDAAVAALTRSARSLGAQLVIGNRDDSKLAADDDDVKCVGMGPQWELLKRASVFVTHGGHNSVMEGLARGVPMLVSPQSTDQPLQAHFLTKQRLARRISSLDNPRTVHRALAALLSDHAMHRRLARYKTLAARSDGADLAARLVLRAAK